MINIQAIILDKLVIAISSGLLSVYMKRDNEKISSVLWEFVCALEEEKDRNVRI